MNNEVKVESELKNKQNNTMYLYSCSKCNSNIISSSIISKCIYCKSPDITKKEYNGKLPKTHIIPFKIDKNSTINIYKKKCREKIFKAKIFNVKKVSQEFIGIYVPFYLYNCDSNGLVELNCKKNTSWKTGNYKYKKIDTYLVTRDGNMSFENIPMDTTGKFNNIIDLIGPYNYKEVKTVDYSDFNLYALASNSMKNEEILKESILRTKKQFIEEIKKSTEGYEEIETIKNSINLYNSKINSILLPIWLLNIKYKDKVYTFAINGQTGKFTGNIPLNINKIIITWIILFIMIFIFLFLIFLIGVIL